MLDPITSLLATCVNCNQPDRSVEQPNVTTCNAEQRSNRGEPSHSTLTDCISPPEAAPAALRLSAGTIEASIQPNQSQTSIQNQTTQPQPASPESGVLVSWSNSSTRAPANMLVSASTRKPVNSAANPTANPTANLAASGQSNSVLQIGSRGQAVVRLQTKLQQLGHYGGAIDGIYGPQTRAAVAQLQRSKRLQADGVVGSGTWAALQASSPQPQSAKPPVQSPQANTPGDRPAPQAPAQTDLQTANQARTQTSQSAPVVAAPVASQTQLNRSADRVPQSPLTYLGILGWGLLYGSGWVFILKDTVKELKGFHFVLSLNEKNSKKATRQMAAHLQKAGKAAPVVVIQNAESSNIENINIEQRAEHTVKQNSEATAKHQGEKNSGNSQSNSQSTVASANHSPIYSPIDLQSIQIASTVANRPANGHSPDDSSNHSDNHSNHPTRMEEFALHDPWQQENEALSVQVLDVILANDGQVQPIQNVFVVAPRPTINNRRRFKKPVPIIYDVKSMRQQVKTG